MASKTHHWFKSSGHFSEGTVLAYWWSCIGKGLRLQPGQQNCLYYKTNITKILFIRPNILNANLFTQTWSQVDTYYSKKFVNYDKFKIVKIYIDYKIQA